MVITLLRTLMLYIFVTIGIRLMGKRQIGDMQPNELVVTLLISEIAAIPLQDITQPIINGVIAIFVLVVIEILLSVLSMKSNFFRKLLSGQSVIIIENGKINEQAMRKVRLTLIDLVELLRAQAVFDIDTVAYAILEVNGSLSVLLKNSEQPPTKKDMNIKAQADSLMLPVIADGKIIPEALKNGNIKATELNRILKSKHLSESDVFLMMLDSDGNHRTVTREDSK